MENKNAIAEKSKLYKTLLEMYEKNGAGLESFKECVALARNADKDEVYFVLHELKYLDSDLDVGDNDANAIIKIAKYIAGNNARSSFMIAVLEAGLDR